MLERLGIGLRALVYLRSMARSLATLARIAEREFPARPRAMKPQRIDLSELDVREVQRRWDLAREAEASGIEIDTP